MAPAALLEFVRSHAGAAHELLHLIARLAGGAGENSQELPGHRLGGHRRWLQAAAARLVEQHVDADNRVLDRDRPALVDEDLTVVAREIFERFAPLDHLDIGGRQAILSEAMFLIGACYDGSGINASETLKNENFRPHPALKPLLEWHSARGAQQDVRNAATRALAIYAAWERSHKDQVRQLSFFEDL